MTSPIEFNSNNMEAGTSHIERTDSFLDKIRRGIGDQVLGATLAIMTAAGCGGKVDDSATDGTLTFTTKDPEKGLLSGTFKSDGHKISFEIARREANPVEELGPNTPRYAIDGRICDENKFCFAQQAGGHAFADPDWVPDDSEENTPDGEHATKNFKTAWSLHNELEKSDPADFAGLTEEYQALENISNEPPDQWITSLPEEAAPESNMEMPQKSLAAVKATGTNIYMHHFEIHAQQLVNIPTIAVAYHSSTYTQVFAPNGGSAWRTVSEYATCNHGACANTIPFSCSLNFMNRPKTIPINTKCIASAATGTKHPQGYTGCCMTQYDFWGESVSHVCNDDSHLQRDFMVAGGPVGQTYCSDTRKAWLYPDCR